jgi:putative toxin-antitoxin system antitoxin component (TIGR02293 family)
MSQPNTHSVPDTMASVLGISTSHGTPTTLEMIDQIQKGFPVRALYRISNSIAPDDASFKFLLISKATLARRKQQPGGRLTADESDRLARLAKVWTFANEVWGTPQDARAFLFRGHPLLSDQRPIDVIRSSDLGARLVEDILGRLKYGSAA